MPLHEWTDCPGWEGVHHLWISELLHWIKPRLPEGFRAYIGSAPVLAVGAPAEKPDVSVRQWTTGNGNSEATPTEQESEWEEPDEEVMVETLDASSSIYVERRGRLISAVELISPRNKDRITARARYTARYVGYLLEGVHLLLVDVHRRPLQFSFANQIAEELQMESPDWPAPFAVSYRVGEADAKEGRLLSIWRRRLTVAEALPSMVLPLSEDQTVKVDLEQTYANAAADAYLT